MNYYKLLNITPFANSSEIDEAYHKYIKKYNNIKDLEQIHKAYSILSDFHSRCIYDKQITNKKTFEPNNNFVNKNCSTPQNINTNKLLLETTDSKIEKYLLNIINRLDKIENKINKNFLNFYKEQKIITKTIKPNGTKIESSKTIINNNGVSEVNTKLTLFNNQGKIINVYRDNRIKNNLNQ